MMNQNDQSSLKRLIDIGLALSAEKNSESLMERILLEAKSLSNADGGTLYLKDGEHLEFEIIRTDSLNIAQGGTTGKHITLPPVPLYFGKKPNMAQVASNAAISGNTINIEDAYEADGFDFSGTKAFDAGTGYRSKSFLTVPLKNHQEDCIGVLQLLNAMDPDTGDVIAFSQEIQPLIEALSSQAAVALENQQLLESQKKLLESFIELMASAVDAKSPYTGGHCQRVPELTKMIAAKLCESDEEKFVNFDLNEDEWYELHIAGWLHDCGKVTTPEYVVDKATKLETITDRIHEIRTRFEVLKRDAEIKYLKGVVQDSSKANDLKKQFDEEIANLDDDFAFIAESNVGGEFMAPDRIERVHAIAQREWLRTLDDRVGIANEELMRREKFPASELPVKVKLLEDRPDHVVEWDVIPHAANPDNPYGFDLNVPEKKYNLGEVHNLCIKKGTLTEEERFKINDHIVQTIVMLEQLPFPEHLKRVPEYAGGHHETLIGTGYPKKLDSSNMSIPARVMAIADIFEALTASDRPYKKAKSLSEAIKIMTFFVKDQHIDADIFEIFLRSGVYQEYADKFLDSSQLDEIEIEKYL